MNKSPTETIYRCLTADFWTNRQCRNCQQAFTLTDYHTHNYYLNFWEVKVRPTIGFSLSLDNACLDGVIIHLYHCRCPLTKPYPLQECSTEIIQEATNNYE